MKILRARNKVADNNSLAISNAEIVELVEKTPASGKRRGIGMVAAVATLGSFLFGYDTGVLSGALPYMYMPKAGGGLLLNKVTEGTVGGTLLIGAAFGALIGGRLSDRYGRRHNLIMLAVIFIVGALACAFSPNLIILYFSRFILGFAVGGASATVPVYLSETAPKRIRGTIVAIDQLMIVTGQLAAFSFNAVISHMVGGPKVLVTSDPHGLVAPGEHSWQSISALSRTLSEGEYHHFLADLVIKTGNGDAWRYMLILCTIPAILLWLGMRLVPESPRWHFANRDYVGAIGSLKRLRDDRDEPVADEMVQMVERDLEKELANRKAKFTDIFKTPWIRKLFFVGLLIASSNQLTGVNTVMYYAPKVLEFAGMSTSAAIASQVANGVMSVIGAAIGLFLVFKFRRRQVLLFCVAGVAVCMFTISALFGLLIEPHLNAGTTPAISAAISVLVVMGVFMIIVQSSNGPVVWTMLGEMFPAHIRGITNGTAVFFLWIINAVVVFTFPIMMEDLGGILTYTIYGVINVAMFIALWFLMPETAGLSMEEIEVAMKDRFSK